MTLEIFGLVDFFGAITFPSWLDETAIQITEKISVKWYGIAYIVGLFGAYFYAKRTSENKPIWQADSQEVALVPSKRMLEDYMFFCLLGIILGGRLGFVFLYDLGAFIKEPFNIFKVWEGGMSFHGGFLGVCAATLYMAKSRKLRLMRVADLAAISAPIGLGLVRLANFVNQELWGRETDVPWAFRFYNEYGTLMEPRHPSQLYEAFLEGLVIFSVLWIASRRFKILTKPGLATGLFLVMYGSFRFLVEFVREPDFGREQFGFLTRGQAYSLPMLIIGVLVLLWAAKRKALAPEWPVDEAKAIETKKG